MINVVSFDTLIKAYLQRGQFAKGSRVNRRNEEGGPAANLANFNELINAMIYKGSAQGRADVRGIVTEVQEAGVKPNRVTGSTLLKCLDANSKEQNIARTMYFISSLDEPMDEVPLSSVIRNFRQLRYAYLGRRIRKPELLSTKSEQLEISSGIPATGSRTLSVASAKPTK